MPRQKAPPSRRVHSTASDEGGRPSLPNDEGLSDIDAVAFDDDDEIVEVASPAQPKKRKIAHSACTAIICGAPLQGGICLAVLTGDSWSAPPGEDAADVWRAVTEVGSTASGAQFSPCQYYLLCQTTAAGGSAGPKASGRSQPSATDNGGGTVMLARVVDNRHASGSSSSPGGVDTGDAIGGSSSGVHSHWTRQPSGDLSDKPTTPKGRGKRKSQGKEGLLPDGVHLSVCSLHHGGFRLDYDAARSLAWLMSAGAAALEVVEEGSAAAGAGSSSSRSATSPTTARMYLYDGIELVNRIGLPKARQAQVHVARLLSSPGVLMPDPVPSGCPAGLTGSMVTSDVLVPIVTSSSDDSVITMTDQEVYAAAAPLPGENGAQATEVNNSQAARLRSMLQVTLRKYQQRGLQWMLQREAGQSSPDQYLGLFGRARDEQGREVKLHPAWIQCRGPTGTVCYASPWLGQVSTDPMPPVLDNLRSGIYADEMGLGKTVVTLGLVACTDRHMLTAGGQGASASLQATTARLQRLTEQSEANSSSDTGLSNESDVACICGATYSTRAPLVDPFRLAHMGARARAAVLEGGQADSLTWVQCEGCKRWQHALCGGLPEDQIDEASFVCTECQAVACAGQPLLSPASLIICPVPIMRQWQSEINKNAVVARDADCDAMPVNEGAGTSAAGASSSSSSAGGPSSGAAAGSASPGLRVVYYAGVRATLQALRECTSAANRLIDTIKGLQSTVDSLRAGLPKADVAALDKELASARKAEHARAAATMTPSPGPATASASALKAADEAGVAVGLVSGAVVIGGEVYDFGDSSSSSTANHNSSSANGAARGAHFDDDDEPIIIGDEDEDEAMDDIHADDGDDGEEELSDDGFTLRPKKSTAARKKAGRSRLSAGQAGRTPTVHASWDAPSRLARLRSAQVALDEAGRKRTAAETAAVRLAKSLSPLYLTQADIVLTTYGALEADLYHADTAATPLLAGAAQIGTMASRLPVEARENFLAERLRALLGGDNSWHLPPPGSLGVSSPSVGHAASSSDKDALPSAGTKRKASHLTRLGVQLDAATGAIVSLDGKGKGMFDLNQGLNVANGSRQMRRAKKYRVVPTPLLAVKWHRAALDEAQMIDQPAAKAAVMAGRLAATHRWAISGTPLSRHVSDLHGLLLFLGVAPWDDKGLFTKALLAGAEAGDSTARLTILKIAHDVMWRTRKSDVLSELGLPSMTAETLFVSFSRIEEAFYRREFGRLLAKVQPTIAQWRREERQQQRTVASSPLRPKSPGTGAGAGASCSTVPTQTAPLTTSEPLSRKEADKVLGPLLRLRQACVHPQIGASGWSKRGDKEEGSRGRKGEVLPMAVLLDHMLAKAKVEAEDRLRDAVASHNGLAGLAWLAKDWEKTAHHYQAVLDLADGRLPRASAPPGQQLEPVRVDKMQHIHALRNYAMLIREHAGQETATSMAKAESNDTGPQAASAGLHAVRLDRHAAILEDEVVRSAGAYVQTELGKFRKDVLQEMLTLMHVAVAYRSDAAPGPAIASSSGSGSGSSSSSAAATDVIAAAPVNLRGAVALSTGEVMSVLGALDVSARHLDNCVGAIVLELYKRIRTSDRTKAVVEAGTQLLGVTDNAVSLSAAGASTLKSITSPAAAALLWPKVEFEGLKLLMVNGLAELAKVRLAAIKAALQWTRPSSADVAATSDCRVCRADWGKIGEVCHHCAARRTLVAYRAVLMAARQQEMDEQTAARQAKEYSASGRLKRMNTKVAPGAAGDLKAWLSSTGAEEGAAEGGGEDTNINMRDGTFMTPTALVRALRALARECKGVQVDLGDLVGRADNMGTGLMTIAPSAPGEGTAWSKECSMPGGSSHHQGVVAVVDAGAWLESVLTALQAESQALHDLHRTQADLLSAVDELSASLTRMALAPPGKELSDAEAVYLCLPGELPERRKTLSLQLAGYEGDLKKALGQLAYLHNIRAEEAAEASLETRAMSADASAAAPTGTGDAAAQCIICRDDAGASDKGNISIISKCAHRFCRSCLKALIKASTVRHEIYGKQQLKCPQCRVTFGPSDVLQAATGEAAVALAKATADAAAKSKGTDAGASSTPSRMAGAGSSSLPPLSSELVPEASGISNSQDPQCLAGLVNDPSEYAKARLEPSMAVAGSFGAKVEALVLGLKAIRGRAGPVKSLVFSQWDEALAIVQAACERNGIKVHRVSSAKHASDVNQAFSSDPTSWALLLPLTFGAEGLNITVATHVWFLEPSLRPALEEQAIGRVWRMGQTKPTYTHRLIVRGTVEETVHSLNRQRDQRLHLHKDHLAESRTGHHAGYSLGAGADSSATLPYQVALDDLQSLLAMSVSEGLAHAGAGTTAAGRGKGGSDTAGMTRGDVLALFAAEEAFQESLVQGGAGAGSRARVVDDDDADSDGGDAEGLQPEARDEPRRSAGAGTSDNALNVEQDDEAEDAGDTGLTPSLAVSSIQRQTRGRGRGRPAGGARGAGQSADTSAALVASANHHWWSTRVRVGTRELLRLAALPVLEAQAGDVAEDMDEGAGASSSSLSGPSRSSTTPEIDVFGRRLPLGLARALVVCPVVTGTAAHTTSLGESATTSSLAQSGGTTGTGQEALLLHVRAREEQLTAQLAEA